MPAYTMGTTASSGGMPTNFMEWMQYQQQQRSKMLLWGGLILLFWQSSNQASVENQRSTTIADKLDGHISDVAAAADWPTAKPSVVAALSDCEDALRAGSTATGVFGGGSNNNNMLLLLGVVFLASSGGF